MTSTDTEGIAVSSFMTTCLHLQAQSQFPATSKHSSLHLEIKEHLGHRQQVFIDEP